MGAHPLAGHRVLGDSPRLRGQRLGALYLPTISTSLPAVDAMARRQAGPGHGTASAKTKRGAGCQARSCAGAGGAGGH